MEEVISKRAKKIVKWGLGMVVFVTTEAKELGWDPNSLVRVCVVKDGNVKKITIEEIGRL